MNVILESKPLYKTYNRLYHNRIIYSIVLYSIWDYINVSTITTTTTNHIPYINRVGIDVSYQQMKTDEITTPNYFIHGQTETPYHHTGETGTRQIISSYLNKQNDNGAY